MRKLLVFVLVLGLLPGLAACGNEPAPTETTAETTLPETEPETTAAPDEIAEWFKTLLECEGVLPDEDVFAFAHFLDGFCEGLLNFHAKEYPFLTAYGNTLFSDPDYPALASALEGKLSPGAARWLALKAEENDCEPDYDIIGGKNCDPSPVPTFEQRLRLAKDWYTFEIDYPALAASEYSAYYHNNSADWLDNYLDSGDGFDLTEEGQALYTAKQKASMKEFLADKNNKKYPFYDEIQADYNKRFK